MRTVCMPLARSPMPLMLAAALLATAPAAAEIVAAGQSQAASLACGGQDALVRGNGNTVRLSGACRSLRVEGSRNIVGVELGRAAAIRVTGDYNLVEFAPPGPPPVTTLRGYYNQVVPGDSVRPGAALVLDGRLGLRDIACGDLDVVVRESSAQYVLRGGCRSLTVQGSDDTIAAELLPAARLVVGGTNVVVNYVLTAQGSPPLVQVTAPGARATHLARFGESALVLPTR